MKGRGGWSWPGAAPNPPGTVRGQAGVRVHGRFAVGCHGNLVTNSCVCESFEKQVNSGRKMDAERCLCILINVCAVREEFRNHFVIGLATGEG